MPQRKDGGAAPRIEIRPLTDCSPDDQNANAHSARGQALVEKSMRERGFFRPIAAAGKGQDKPVVKAGNLTQETAINIGLDEAIFVYTDGTRPIVHVRTDLDPDSVEAALLAIEDNRASEVSLKWDPEVMAQMNERLGDDMSHLFNADELRSLLDAGGLKLDNEINFDEFSEAVAHEIKYRVVIDNLGHEEAEELAENLVEFRQGEIMARVEQYRAK